MRRHSHKIAIAAVAVLAVVALAAVAVVRPGADDQAAAEGGNPAGPEFQLEPGLSQAIARHVLFEAVEAQQIREYVAAVEAQQVTDYLRGVEAATREAAERRAAAASSAPAVSNGSVWDRLARCESGGNWAMNSGNGFYGGIQFMHSTWVSMGGRQFAEYPHQASREGQIAVAERLLAASGWGQWPACSAKLGLR